MPRTRRPVAPVVRLLVAPAVGAVALALAAGTLRAQGHAGHHAPAAAGQPADKQEKKGEAHGKHGAGEGHHALPWKALDAYHTVMAASWHPAKDRDDLAPFRAKATELAAAARALTTEPVPAACGGPSKAPQVEALVRASEEAAKLATDRTVADAPLKAALRQAHDRFHAVEEGCGAKH